MYILILRFLRQATAHTLRHLKSGRISRMQIYRQKRGTITCEQVDIGSEKNSIIIDIIDAYGSGNEPILQGSEIETGWTPATGSIYQKIIARSPGITGFGTAVEDGTPLSICIWDTDVAAAFSGVSAGLFLFDYGRNIQ